MHGPDEVAFADDVLSVEDVLGVPRHTVKLGIMDESAAPPSTSRSAYAPRSRALLHQHGCLDRTGDEIHTSMAAGVMVRKGD